MSDQQTAAALSCRPQALGSLLLEDVKAQPSVAPFPRGALVEVQAQARAWQPKLQEAAASWQP